MRFRRPNWLAVLGLILAVLPHRLVAQFTFIPAGAARTSLYANDVVLKGNYAYVSYESIGLCIYNVSNPQANPVFVTKTNNGGSPEGLVLSGHYIYLANYNDGLRVYDISNPALAANIAHTNNGGLAWNVAIQSNYLYLANATDGLRVYDVSDPANIINVGHANDGGIARGVAVSGNYAYLANSTNGLRIYDISDPANVFSVANTNNGYALTVAVFGNYAYVLHTNAPGLAIYDVSDPIHPQRIGEAPGVSSKYPFHPFAMAGSLAYIAMNDGIHVFDVSNPASPVDGGYTNVFSMPYIGPSGVALSGNYIYIANQADAFRIFKVVGPKVSVTLTPTNSTLVSWPSNYLAFVLQQNSDFNAANWFNVTNTPEVVSNRSQVILPATEASAFFRLKLQ